MALVLAAGGVVSAGTDQDGSIVISPCGELDVALAPTVLATLREAIARAPRRIVLDLSSLEFLDSGGCDALETGWREARAAGIRVALCDEMPRTVRRVLALTRLLAAFDPVWPLAGPVGDERPS